MAVLLLTQLSRGVEGRDDKRPQLSDLRDSGAIEQDADVVMMLYREAYYLERKRKAAKSADEMIDLDDAIHACRNKAEVLIEKQRNGGVGSVDVFVDLPFSHFANAARDGYADMRQRYGSAE
jgi:replicative DNA helicase